jgi:hypothetical protein
MLISYRTRQLSRLSTAIYISKSSYRHQSRSQVTKWYEIHIIHFDA